MKSYFLLGLLGLASAAEAQTDSVRITAQRTLVLKTSPIDLLIPHKTTLWLSAEKRLSNKFSWQTDVGYIFRDDALFDFSEVVNASFPSTDRQALNFNLKTEIRRYLSKRDIGMRGAYAAAQLFYKQVNYNSNQAPEYDWYEETDLLMVTSYWRAARRGPEDNYKIKLQEKGGHLKMGYQHIFRNRFTFDSFVGLGVRHFKESQDIGEQNPDSSFSGNGSVIPSLAFGFKLGYAF
ncbi:hypothetical protein [Hymenobacter koreensis]|uniref:DUF3575 domain-containing protein n=1 Tax=Hymenobacter koreensis TaxID=1084523 RepID=A0ABP8IVQ4_9BACT